MADAAIKRRSRPRSSESRLVRNGTPSTLNVMQTLFGLLSFLLFINTASATVTASDIPWTGQVFRYTATQKSLRDLLVEFGIANGVNIVVSPELDKVVSVRLNDPPQVVLNSLASSFGLIWFYDGSVLYIEPATSARTEIIQMTYGTVAELMGVLRRIKIPEGRYRLNPDTEQNILLVSGPERYVELVKTIASSVDNAQASRRQTAVRVFPLKRAWAADFKVKQSGGDVEIPGVVSLLRKLYGPQPGRPFGDQPLISSPIQAAKSSDSKHGVQQMQSDPSSQKKGLSPMTPRLAFGQQSAGPLATQPKESGLPSFEADPSSNSVLVRDLADRIDQYATVIEGLDQGGGLIEIEVTIMDISSSAFGRLGVDWELFSAKLDGGAGLRGSVNNLPTGLADLPRLPGLAANAVIGGAQRRLIAKVTALEQSGQGRIVARPKVLTMNNVEAVLENTETFYVKSEGQYSSNLFDVTAGTSVRVLPLMLSKGEAAGVKMAIAIEDGGIQDVTDANIPRIKRSSINTQAVVAEGESVLLAGYSRDELTRSQAGIPWLSKLPIVGNVFGYSQNDSKRSERYYLVTPRIIRPLVAFDRSRQDER